MSKKVCFLPRHEDYVLDCMRSTLGMAVENQVDVIGLSILSGTHLIIAENIRKTMNERGIHFSWVVGGNIPAQDVDALMKLGPDKVFPTGTYLDEIIAYFNKIRGQKGS